MKKVHLFLIIILFQLSFAQQNLTETQKLATTCKVWGFLKYYHPNVTSGKFNWDEKLFTILPKVEKAVTNEDFSKVLENWIVSLGEVKKITPIKDSGKFTYFYKNLDLNWLNNNTCFSKKVSEKLEFIKNNRAAGKQHYVYLEINNENSSLGIKLQNEIHYSDFKWDDRNLRILSLFKYWNIIEYFYPNKYLMDQKWDTSLTDVLSKFTVCTSEEEFHEAVGEIISKISDSHSYYYPEYKGMAFGHYFMPVNFKVIDDKMVITKILNDSVAKSNDLRLGDAIVSVDKKLISQIKNEYRNKVFGSNETAYLREFVPRFSRFINDKLEIEFFRDSKKAIKSILLYDDNNFFHDLDKRSLEKYKLLENNIGYVDMGRNLDDIFNEMVLKLKTTKAIIFDLRNYPKSQAANDLVQFINAKVQPFAKSTNPDLSYPGRYFWSKPFLFEASKDYYKGKVVVLVDENTQSWSETIAMQFKTSKNTTVIGSQTAGADGAGDNIKIMKGVETAMTGVGFYYPDGKEVQRIGIVPDIEVKPTIEGIKQGKDEVLDRAIKFIKTGK